MKQVLDRLCVILEDEAERQETVLTICRGQREAVEAQDLVLVEAKTAALDLLIRDAAQAEGERTALLRKLVNHYGFPVAQQTLTDLIRVVPAPWTHRLRDFQARIRNVLEESRTVVRATTPLLRRSVHMAEECLRILEPGPIRRRGEYTACGRGVSRAGQAAAVLDQRG